jgi:diaminohydroxyphosphoribosylaminopyrimidine deaminase/5-amino-6-(5-phosphoribosylamino)uracil reductase
LVGWKTVQQDNPKLTNRLAGGTSPLRVVIDRNQRLSTTHHLFSDFSPTLYVTNAYRNDLPKWVDQFSPVGEGKLWLQSLLTHLLEDFQIGTLLVEGGATTLDYFIKEGLWDELYVFQSAYNCHNIEQALYFALPPSRLEQSINLVNDRLNLYKPIGREN